MTPQNHAAGERARHSVPRKDARSESLMQHLRREWRAFRGDSPGQRFKNQHRRMREAGSAKLRALAIGLGVVLLAGGVVLLFVPGPGLIVVVFGLALLAGESRTLAGLLDRAEPHVRRWHAGLRRWWGRRGWPARAAIIAGLAVLAAGAALLAWLWFVR